MNDQNHTEQTSVDQRIHDLINGSIDGEITSTEQDDLDRFLANSQSVRNLNDELRAVTQILDDLPEIDPPEFLQSAIKRQVRLPVQSSASVQKPGFPAGWLNANWLRTGLALAAGVVLTVGLYEMGSEPITARDAANMSGTMAKSGQTERQEILVGSVNLNTGKLNGLVELHNKDDLFTLDLQLKSDGPSEVVVNFAGSGLEIDGVSGKQHPVDAVSIADGSIRLTSSGEQHYVLKLMRVTQVQQAAPLELDFFVDGKLIQQSELNVSQF